MGEKIIQSLEYFGMGSFIRPRTFANLKNGKGFVIKKSISNMLWGLRRSG